jgi:hypothetical protein
MLIQRSVVACLLSAAPAVLLAQTAPATSPASLTIKATNKLSIARASETIELSAKDLAPLGEKDLKKIHVADASGKELLTQAIDNDGDEMLAFDAVLFQSAFGPGETKTFTVTAGKKVEYKKEDFKAYGRFNRERFDDFAWENDRIAHRIYGKALETWKGEPLTSSAVDVWLKRTPRLVQNDWYMLENYHSDAGEGADFYSAGPSRGVGGNGLWAADKLWTSKNYVQSRTLASGPIRVLFELTYEPFDVDGNAVAETKRISLDAGQSLDHLQSVYKPSKPGALTCAIGIRKKGPGVALTSKDLNAAAGWLATWEPVEKGNGNMGAALVLDPKQLQDSIEDERNVLLRVKVPDNNAVSYWAGAGWDKNGFADYAAWKAYVEQFAQGVASPIVVIVSK